MRLLVCGGLDLPEAKVHRMMDLIHPTPAAIILSGPGNSAALAWAEANGAEVEIHQPDLAVRDGRPGMVLAFPGGCEVLVAQARAAGLLVMNAR